MTFITKKSNTLEKITNSILIPLRILRDKSADAIKTYTSNEEKPQVERYYPKKNFVERLGEYIVFFSKPTPVYPGLFLGSVSNANSWDTLVEYNIKYIINVSDELTNWYSEHIEYYQIPIKDNNNESMQPYFDEACNKIDDFMNRGDGNVLVHCFFGASRSATIIIEYLRRKTGEPVEQIIERLKEMRSVINPTQQFINDLKNNVTNISTNSVIDKNITNDENINHIDSNDIDSDNKK
jgi:protein-tyrosine phosphatase